LLTGTTLDAPALARLPALAASGADVWQSSRRHSLFAQPLKAKPPKLDNRPKATKRETSRASAGFETRPETIR
jgi:hypothetical protein